MADAIDPGRPPGSGGHVNGPFFTFDTTHHALWAEEVAAEAGIPTEVVPTPARSTARCNLAIVTLPDEFERLRSTLGDAEVPFEIFDPESPRD